MKRTLNLSIGSVAFIIDEDAYYTIRKYFDDIRSRLCDTDIAEIMDDVESRVADIFMENINGSSQVVDISLVNRAIAIIGSAKNFGDAPKSSCPPPPRRPSATTGGAKKLYRSRSECIIAGLCGGVAEYFCIDVTMVRIVTFILIFFGGLSFWVYILCWIILPQQPVGSDYFKCDRKK